MNQLSQDTLPKLQSSTKATPALCRKSFGEDAHTNGLAVLDQHRPWNCPCRVLCAVSLLSLKPAPGLHLLELDDGLPWWSCPHPSYCAPSAPLSLESDSCRLDQHAPCSLSVWRYRYAAALALDLSPLECGRLREQLYVVAGESPTGCLRPGEWHRWDWTSCPLTPGPSSTPYLSICSLPNPIAEMCL